MLLVILDLWTFLNERSEKYLNQKKFDFQGKYSIAHMI